MEDTVEKNIVIYRPSLSYLVPVRKLCMSGNLQTRVYRTWDGEARTVEIGVLKFYKAKSLKKTGQTKKKLKSYDDKESACGV